MDKPTIQQTLTNLGHMLGPIKSFMDDVSVQEIMINGPNDVWVERGGRITKQDVAITDIQIKGAIQMLAKLARKDAEEGTVEGIVDTRLEGFRVAGVLSPTAVRGHAMSIRKHNPVIRRMADYVDDGSIPEELASQLIKLVVGRKNILIVGGTSSGKTTFMNGMVAEIPPDERIFTIEDTTELRVNGPNWVQLESNEQKGVTTRHLLKLALRFRPDRILVGEVRGGEAYDLMQAANTGHDGCIATIHANSAIAALSRLETLVLTSGVEWPYDAIRRFIADTFDVVVFMARRQVDGVVRRTVAELMLLKGWNHENSQYDTEYLHQS